MGLKLSVKMKKNIRKAVAGVCLATSVLVAAIPADNSGIARADNANETLDYNGDRTSTDNRNGEFSSDVSLTKPTSGIYLSYEIREIGNDLVLRDLYQYYVTSFGSSTNQGVICGYNDKVVVPHLDLGESIVASYELVTTSEFSAYVTDTINPIVYTFSESPYANGTDQNGNTVTPADAERYFRDEFSGWKAQYEAALEKYLADGGDPNKNPSSSVLASYGCPASLTLQGTRMKPEQQRIYYCDHTQLHNQNLQGFTLVEVKNQAQDTNKSLSWVVDSQQNTEPIPSGDVYAVRLLDPDNLDSETQKTYHTDAAGYLYRHAQQVNAIGDEAFKGAQQVAALSTGTNISYIGDNAFENSYIQKVDFASVLYIGNYVFKDCEFLAEIDLGNASQIGKEAFYGCKVLTGIKFPNSGINIGFGAFAECPVLQTVDFTGSHDVMIGEYAFYNCPQLFNVQFPADYSVGIGKAAFALAPGSSESVDFKMTEFQFPTSLKEYQSTTEPSFQNYTLYRETYAEDGTLQYGDSYTSPIGDYLLANRRSLNTVLFPSNYGSASGEVCVPPHTFDNCLNLGKVEFSQNSIYVTFDNHLFEDVQNTALFVYGPGYVGPQAGADIASPRKATWEATTAAADYVPYVYPENGTDHYEVGIKPYRYELETYDDGTASLVNCQFIDPSDPENVTMLEKEPLIIPGRVADYNITALEDGCFKDIKDDIVNLVIADDSIQEIGEGVFSGCDKLATVKMGNSVQTIGEKAFSDNPSLTSVVIGEGIASVNAGAFSNCPALENVTWETPSSYSTLAFIAPDAFMTEGDKLYFEGQIEEGYLPFDYAMGNNKINAMSTRICYVSPLPNRFYVIRDEETNENLLLDYPHYFDLPADLISRYENNEGYSDEEAARINATRNISLPEEITSIDIRSFLNSENSNNPNRKNWVYIDGENSFGYETISSNDVSDGSVTGNGFTQQDIYNNDGLIMPGFTETMSDHYKTGYHPGLFSGYYFDNRALQAAGEDSATVNSFESKGNDWIQSISMPGVTEIPDYAFDSCESLESVIISDACDKIGASAFINCDRLTAIGTGNSTKYLSENYILYEVLPDGTYSINTCLPARGANRAVGELWVNSNNDAKLANVTSLREGAFDSCKHIIGIDLSDTSIETVPTGTFNGCAALNEVKLPETIGNIEEHAFKDNAASLSVTIPHDALVSDYAFDQKNTTTTIYTYPESELIQKRYGTPEEPKVDNIFVKYIGSEYTIIYYYDDYTAFETLTVASGTNGYYPEQNPEPKLPVNQGMIFDKWEFYYADTRTPITEGNPIVNVTENRYAIPIYKENPEAKTFTITYHNDDYSLFYTMEVREGNNAMYPEEVPTPKMSEHQGWVFDHWNFYDNANGLANVTEDRNAIAVFKQPSVSSNQPPVSGNQPPVSGNQPGNPNDDGQNNDDNNNGNNNNNDGNNNGNNNNGNNSASNNSASNNAAGYNVVVENGAGGGRYQPGRVVTITAYAPATGRVFDRWTTSNTDIGFANAYGASTTFIMPTHDVKVTATYKQQTASSNNASQNRVSGNNANNNNRNNNSNSTNSNGNQVNRNPSNQNGTEVTVTTETIDNNHKNLVSATVSGSTDNFVVKITDSASAYAAVEQALRAQYGDLTNIRFVGFDISLYDETGTNKITNTNGLAVTITLPIPDDLVPYAGNNKAAGVVNGGLDPMTVKFTTIDGVPCMQFTATHFSPYTIYVNTDTLTLGVTDSTPKTGDGIHPKWFLAIGLACISGILFTWKDKKRVAV